MLQMGGSGVRPTYTCYRPILPIKVDGSPDEIAWRQAPVTGNFRLPNGKPGKQATYARMLWDDEFLYIAFDIHDDYVWATMTTRDDKLWEEEVVEVFLEPTGTGRPYYEFEINHLNTVIDLLFTTWPKEEFEQAVRWNCDGWLHDVKVRDDGWTAEMAIPWKSLPGVQRPRPGEAWSINLCRIDRPRNKKDPDLLAWGPTNNFHKLEAMGKVTFADRPAVQPTPPGPYTRAAMPRKPRITSWTDQDRLVGTYYFYWYNVYTGEHINYEDGASQMQDHPANMEDFAYSSDRWHAKENADVTDAGIDFILPVYWGEPGYYEAWSFEGLRHLVAAQEKMLAEHKRPPRIGLFYDTSTLLYNTSHLQVDLNTEHGKEWFYCTIRDFFSLIPPKRWACINGQPIVFLYSAAFASGKYDQSVIDYTIARFQDDFWGIRPWIVRETSWDVKTPMRYAWGAALAPNFHDVTCIGPGYDHTAVRGREPLIRDREGGRFYERSWLQALRHKSNIVMIETWNELHEGTDICETKQYGKQYIDLTRKYATLFKHGKALATPDHLMGPHALDAEVSLVIGEPADKGLRLRPPEGDGLHEIVAVGGRECVRALPNPFGPGRYLYFDLPDGFMEKAPSDRVEVEVTYYDEGTGAWAIEYDSTDFASSVREGAFRGGGSANLTDTKTWKTVKFELKDCNFANRCNGGDFRLSIPTRTLCVVEVTVRKLK